MTITRVISPEGKRLKEALKHLEGKVGKVGWFEGARYNDAKATPVAYVATIHEYGSPKNNIPPRPFIRPAISKHEHEWAKIAEAGSKAVLAGHTDIGTVMEAIGQKAKAHIQKEITLVYSPALAEKTILARIRKNSTLSKKKGRLSERSIGLITKPLIDTGHMLATVANTVESE